MFPARTSSSACHGEARAAKRGLDQIVVDGIKVDAVFRPEWHRHEGVEFGVRVRHDVPPRKAKFGLGIAKCCTRKQATGSVFAIHVNRPGLVGAWRMESQRD